MLSNAVSEVGARRFAGRVVSCGALVALAMQGLPAWAGDLYSNASSNPSQPALALASSTSNGVPAPANSSWSEVADAGALLGANSVAGFALHSANGASNAMSFRVADDFVVPSGPGWSVSSVTFYVYSPGFQGSSLVGGVSLKIWQGQPEAPGSVLATTVLATPQALPTNVYRVFTTNVGPAISAPDTSRRVWAITLPVSALLQPGTYWLDVQLSPASPGTPIYMVPATLESARTQPSWNARQRGSDGAWAPLQDPGKAGLAAPVAQDLAFLLAGNVGATCDSIDFNNDGGLFDPVDIDAFFSVFSEGPCIPANATCNDIDFNNDGGFFDPADIDSFLSVFSEGPCL